jgi:hypothetical protein
VRSSWVVGVLVGWVWFGWLCASRCRWMWWLLWTSFCLVSLRKNGHGRLNAAKSHEACFFGVCFR